MERSQYLALEERTFEAIDAEQAAIVEILMLGVPEVDFEQGQLRFFRDRQPMLEARFLPLGSWAPESGSWRWAWGNPAVPARFRDETLAIQKVYELTGNEEFVNPDAFLASERRAWGLCAMACIPLTGLGVYRIAGEPCHWFFRILDLVRLAPEELFLERARERVFAVLTEFAEGQEGPGFGVNLVEVPEIPNVVLDAADLEPSRAAIYVNLLRKRFPELPIDLRDVDLRGRQLPWAHDLNVQPLLDRGYARSRDRRDLRGINLSRARLDGAILRGVDLPGACLDGASLIDADLSGADLRGASFRHAFLNGVNFMGARMAGADLADAQLSRTLFTHVDLSEVKGLAELRHLTPSEVSFSTLVESHFQLEASFLRNAGVSRGLLQDLARGKRLPNRMQSCFLSYSSVDAEFAKQLYEALTKAGVRVFWDTFDLIPGDFLEAQISEAISELDRLLVILSLNSMQSKWVQREIEIAWLGRRSSLLPVRLCSVDAIKAWTEVNETLPDLADAFPIQDFSGWNGPAEFGHALSLLLQALSSGYVPPVAFRTDARSGRR